MHPLLKPDLARLRAWAADLGWLAPTMALATFALLYTGFELRGASTWGLWLAEASDRVLPWLLGDVSGAERASALWGAHAALPPLTIVLTTAARALWPSLTALEAAHLISSAAIAGSVPMVWGLGRRAGGLPAAATAVLAFVLTPRIVGHGTAAGFEATAIFGCTFAVYALYRARTSRLWTGLSVLGLTMALGSTQLGLLILAPWLVLLLSDKGQFSTFVLERGRDPKAPPGHVRAASFPLALLIVPLLAVALLALVWPWLWTDTVGHAWAHLTHFLVRPRPATLYLGERIVAGRLPWHAGPALLVMTVPMMTAVLGAGGVFGEMVVGPALRTRLLSPLRPFLHMRPDPEAAGPEAHEAKRWAFAYLVMFTALPWALGASVFGVVDVIGLALPFLCVFVGCTLSRMSSVTAAAVRRGFAQARKVGVHLPDDLTAEVQAEVHIPWRANLPISMVLALVGLVVFLPGWLDTLRTHPVEESYYAWQVGGTAGAVELGLPRYPFGVIPLDTARDLSAVATTHPGAKVALVLDRPEPKRVLARYRAEGLIGPLPAWAPRAQADWLLLLHDDTEPAYYDQLNDVARVVDSNRARVVRSGAVRLVTLGPLHAP